jgi:hypothetical protein
VSYLKTETKQFSEIAKNLYFQLGLKGNVPYLHLITERNSGSKILNVRKLGQWTMYTIRHTYCNMSPSKNVILGLKIKISELLQVKLSGASHQLSRLSLTAVAYHITQLFYVVTQINHTAAAL